MKIGLLTCDRVNDELMSIQGDYPDMFRMFFPTLTFEIYYVYKNQFPENVHACDVYMATGSRASVYDDEEWITRLRVFIRDIHDAGKIYLGVCFGHQMLAEAMGGKVRKSDNGWCIGVHEFIVLEPEGWMYPFQPRLNMLMMCQDQVFQLPENSTLLAYTDDCQVGIFRVGERMLGVQAHPEFSPAYDEALMRMRMERIGAAKVKKGIESLSKPIHDELFLKWALNFFNFAQGALLK